MELGRKSRDLGINKIPTKNTWIVPREPGMCRMAYSGSVTDSTFGGEGEECD